jgi:hypothetical protein
VDVFDLDRALVEDYANFARSFTQIRTSDIRDQVDAIYASGRFWPEPLITVNPHFEQGSPVEALVRNGSLHPDVAHVFRVDGQSITLYRHQTQAVAKALARQSFAVTTGTGSGKSLCFFIPIIDAAIRARAAGEERRTRAIVIYPMDALANSQREELNKFLDQSGLPENLRPTFARYTGQESQDERKSIREAKPDILLTNFMMLELLMTRQSKLDQTVIENAQGLEFIVLDELHTHRGRQGADVAMLVRRLRDRLCAHGYRFHRPTRPRTHLYQLQHGPVRARSRLYRPAVCLEGGPAGAAPRRTRRMVCARLRADARRATLHPRSSGCEGAGLPVRDLPRAEEHLEGALRGVSHRPPRARRLGCAGVTAGRRPMIAPEKPPDFVVRTEA